MPSPSERRRNNVKAGIFVTATMALAVVTIFALANLGETLFRRKVFYTVSFTVTDGVKNLKKGSEVRVGGVLLGRVTDVDPRLERGPFEQIDVVFKVAERVLLYQNARIIVSSALIGTEAWLEIYSVGDSDHPLTGVPITGDSAPGIVAALLGPDNANTATEMIKDLKVTTGNVRELSRQITHDDWPVWSGHIDEVMVWATNATTKIDAVLDEGHGFLVDTRGLVNENRQDIRSTVQNVEASSDDIRHVMATVRSETIKKVHRLLDTGQTGLDQAVAVLESLRDDYEIWATDISETLASARLTSQQLKLTSIEVRRSPWKLLYRPSRTELEHEMLYEAARSFALAGSDLKATTASAERIIDLHESDLDPETVRQLNSLINDSVERYSKAQQRLVDVLVKE